MAASLHSTFRGQLQPAACPSKPRTALCLTPIPLHHSGSKVGCSLNGARNRRGRPRLASASSSPPSDSQQQQQPRKQSQPSQEEDGPSTSGSSVDSVSANIRGPQQPRTPWLVQMLQRMKAPAWLIHFVSNYVVPPPSSRTAFIAKALWITVGFLVVAMGRGLFFPTAQAKPREVLYSDFVSLLDVGRVRSARLEAGTSRLYFDISLPAAAAVPQAAAAAATAASATAATAAEAAAATAAAAPTAAVSTSAGALAAAQSPHAEQPRKLTHHQQQQQQKQQQHRFTKQYYIALADKSDPLLVSRLLQAGVEYSVLRASFRAAAANTLLTALALWLPLTPMLFLLRRIMDQRQGAGRAKKSGTSAATPVTTFADVAGVDAAKAELLEVVSVMRQTKATYSKLKVKMPSGVLLCGPPGTGKTLLAKAVAGEAGVPFFAVSASEFVELYVGRGAARIRELFGEARKAAPCVVFVDELDGVGSRRGMGHNDERDQTLNQLLTELDGFDGRQGVLFLAATNRIDVLDPALLRPGRINRKVVVPLPDAPGRAQILAVHLRGVPLESALEAEAACRVVSGATSGFSGAELANVVNEASLLAARESREEVALRDLLAGAQRTRFGVNGRSGDSAFSGALSQRLQSWLLDLAAGAAASERKPVKVGSSSG